MRHTAIFSTIMMGGAIALGSSHIKAQTVGLDFNTEWQTDFDGGYDWLNQLRLNAELPLCEGLSMQASTYSVAKTGESTLIDDLLTYSNIEAGNIPLTFARLGLGLTEGQAEWFVGINNVNEDYFTSDCTAFFTNSSCGIFPTLSCNYDIANYPMASWSVHYRQNLGNFSLQTSLYPGKGYKNILGHDNLFNLNLKRDGVLSISSVEYNKNDIYCVLGTALYYGVCIGDEDVHTAKASSSPEKTFTAAPWLLSEIALPHNLQLMLQASLSTVNVGCKGYGGIGLIYDNAKVKPGISVNYASFTDDHESDVELCARIPLLSGKAYIQPALHIVTCDKNSTKCVGMLRFSMSL